MNDGRVTSDMACQRSATIQTARRRLTEGWPTCAVVSHTAAIEGAGCTSARGINRENISYALDAWPDKTRFQPSRTILTGHTIKLPIRAGMSGGKNLRVEFKRSMQPTPLSDIPLRQLVKALIAEGSILGTTITDFTRHQDSESPAGFSEAISRAKMSQFEAKRIIMIPGTPIKYSKLMGSRLRNKCWQSRRGKVMNNDYAAIKIVWYDSGVEDRLHVSFLEIADEHELQ